MSNLNIDQGYIVEGYQGRSFGLFDYYAKSISAAKGMASQRSYDRIRVRNADTEIYPEDYRHFIRVEGNWKEVDQHEFDQAPL